MTAWNRLPAVTLKTLFFMIGAEPMDLKRTTTETEISVRRLDRTRRRGEQERE